MVAVATLHTPEIAAYAQLSVAIDRAYCEKHGYVFVEGTHLLDHSRPASWSKLLLVSDYLKGHPDCNWVFWKDADALILNDDTKLESLIDNDYDFIVGKEQEWSPINCGVWLVRNTPAGLRLLSHAYAKEQYINHKWWEQLAIYDSIVELEGAVKAKLVTQRLFNSFASETVHKKDKYQPGDFIAHFCGMNTQRRMELMTQYLRKKKGPEQALAPGQDPATAVLHGADAGGQIKVI